MERRNNWKAEISKAAGVKAQKRDALLVEKDLLSQEIHSLTVEEIRSDKYEQLKQRQAEVVAKLATL